MMDAWWNSIETVSRLNDWVKIAIITFGVLTAIASIFGFGLSKRLSTLQSQESKVLQARLNAAEQALDTTEQRRAEEERAKALEKEREEQRRRTPPALDAYLAFGEKSRELLVVIDAKNDIPFKYQWIVVTEKDKIVTGIPLEYEEIHPATSKEKRWNHKARIHRDRVVNDYIELRFTYESLYSAEFGYPLGLQGKIIHKYKLAGDIPHPLE